MRSILITRPQPAADEMAQKLEREGLSAYAAPLAEYKDVPFTLPDLSSFQAIAFTSAQAVRVFARKTDERALPVFCVGEATERAAAVAGFRKTFCADGDGPALSAFICVKKEALGLKKVLHVSGVDTAENLAPALIAAGIGMERIAVYKAELLNRLPADAERALKTGDAGTVVFFSARAAGQFVEMLKKKEYTKIHGKLEAVCISPRVATALEGAPFLRVSVARMPRLESVMEILRRHESGEVALRPLKAGPVLKAFGGIRPLAKALDITASTVQGWSDRGLIPGGRVDAILKAAKDAGLDAEALLKEAAAMTIEEQKQNTPERRTGADRRTKRTPPDAQGQIRAENYEGPDRRHSVDRRAYQERQRQRIHHEKMKFLNRTTVSVAMGVSAVAYAIFFLLAPEIATMNRNEGRVREMETRMGALNQQIEQLQEEKKKEAPVGGVINTKIEQIEAAADTAATVVAGAARQVAEQMVDPVTVDGLLRLLSHMQALSRTPEGRAALSHAMDQLAAASALAGDNPEDLNAAVAVARKRDDTLSALLEPVGDRNLGPAAILMSLNGLRSDIDRHAPFSRSLDLALKFAGGDPAAKDSLSRLLPYAEKGFANREALRAEFPAVAAAITAAGVASGDASLKGKALKRLSSLVKVRRAGGNVAGDDATAVAARAQAALDSGDVAKAVHELKALQGDAALAAQPWVTRAEGSLIAEETSELLTHAIFQMLSSAATAGGTGPTLEAFTGALKETLPAAAPAPVGGASVPYLSPALQNPAGSGMRPYQ